MSIKYQYNLMKLDVKAKFGTHQELVSYIQRRASEGWITIRVNVELTDKIEDLRYYMEFQKQAPEDAEGEGIIVTIKGEEGK